MTVDSAKNFRNIDIGFGQNGLYLMTWLYYDGSVILYKSMDNGQSWSSPIDVFGRGVWNSFPGMCVFKDGSSDSILIAGGDYSMAKSTDNGTTFSALPDLPMPSGTSWWRYMAIGTNASWFGTAPDNDIYVVGARYEGIPWTGTYIVTFVKSTDGGASWKTPVSISLPDYNCDYPEILSDGSTLYVVYTKLIPGHKYIHVRSSSDWGATWSAENSIPIPTVELGAAADSFQYLDEDKAMLAFSQNSVDPAANCIQYYGYFYFGNKTFQEVGHAVGSDWCFDIAGASCRVINGKDLAMAWIYEPYSTTIQIDTKRLRYAVCSDAGFNTTVPGPTPSEIKASVNIDPDSLDVSSKGNWITAYIDMPAPESVSDIDVSSIRLDGLIPIVSSSIGDFDKDKVQEMMVKFDRALYVETLGAVTEEGRNVMVNVSGSLTDGRTFSGTDTIRVFDAPGKSGDTSTLGGILDFLTPSFPIALIGIAGTAAAITAFIILRKTKHMRGT